MSRESRSRHSRTSRKRLSPVQLAVRFLILAVIISLLGIAGALTLRNLQRQGDTVAVQFELTVNPALGPVEAAGLSAYLALNRDALREPVSDDTTPVTVEILPGQNASQVADALLSLGLISDATLFKNYLRYYGLDRQLEAGSYELTPGMTIPEIAQALTDASPPEVTVRITEGWRREQIADWIDQQPEIPFSGAEFLQATGAGVIVSPQISIAAEIPEGATLEGFLFPDTYRLEKDAPATDLVERMLRNLDEKYTPQMRLDSLNNGLTVYEVITLASIVEREAVVPDERPTIASVYLNRLAAGMRLEADPTVQYAMGYQPETGQWWNLNLTQADYRAVNSPYNTYLYPGLPPGPIANPGLDSIMAVIYPAETPYYYFRATCDGSGRHVFSETFEEHVGNACQ